jgi:hypothetical protein
MAFSTPILPGFYGPTMPPAHMLLGPKPAKEPEPATAPASEPQQYCWHPVMGPVSFNPNMPPAHLLFGPKPEKEAPEALAQPKNGPLATLLNTT